ncbi:hypothetical protein ACFL26_00970 [Patescibacteria group bacterium]
MLETVAAALAIAVLVALVALYGLRRRRQRAAAEAEEAAQSLLTGKIRTVVQTIDGASIRLEMELLACQLPEPTEESATWTEAMLHLERTASETIGVMTSNAIADCGLKNIRGSVRRRLRQLGYSLDERSRLQLRSLKRR